MRGDLSGFCRRFHRGERPCRGLAGCRAGLSDQADRAVVPFVAGGTTDNIARMMAQRFTESWSQTVIVSNRAGGGSVIGTAAVAKSPPDGHTLLVTTLGVFRQSGDAETALRPDQGFCADHRACLAPAGAGGASVLAGHEPQGIRRLYEGQSPSAWTIASSGAGTSTHLAAEMFKSMAGGNLVHVPFKGNAEVMNALLGGHIKIYFSLVPTVLQHIKDGTLRALAVTTDKRLPYLPDVPTIAESGFPGYEMNSWQAVFAPAGTPKDVIAKINGEIVRMLNTPEVRERMSHEGADPVGSTPEEFSKRVASEMAKWSKVVKDIGMAAN